MAQGRKLTRSDNAMIAGVCGGLAAYFDVSPTSMRVAYVALSLLTVGFPGVLVYVILWLVLPKRG
ncbi:MAG: PspC domain-containing protein [Gemmatimonadaceae bacterium]